MPEGPRKTIILRSILGELNDHNFLTPELVSGLKDWEKAWVDGKLKIKAQTSEELTNRTELLMKGIPNSHEVTKEIVQASMDLNDQVFNHFDPESEIGLRWRLSEEMTYCLRRGGIILPDGRTESNVADATLRTIYDLKPDLKGREIPRLPIK